MNTLGAFPLGAFGSAGGTDTKIRQATTSLASGRFAGARNADAKVRQATVGLLPGAFTGAIECLGVYLAVDS